MLLSFCHRTPDHLNIVKDHYIPFPTEIRGFTSANTCGCHWPNFAVYLRWLLCNICVSLKYILSIDAASDVGCMQCKDYFCLLLFHSFPDTFAFFSFSLSFAFSSSHFSLTHSDTDRVNKCYLLLSSFISIMEKLVRRTRWENDVWLYAAALAGLGSNRTHRLHFCVYLPVCVGFYVRYQSSEA